MADPSDRVDLLDPPDLARPAFRAHQVDLVRQPFPVDLAIPACLASRGCLVNLAFPADLASLADPADLALPVDPVVPVDPADLAGLAAPVDLVNRACRLPRFVLAFQAFLAFPVVPVQRMGL